mgnify:CR=1 FL=1
MLKMAHKYIFLSKDDVSIRMRTMIWHKTTTLYSCRVQPRVFPENTLVTGLCFFFFYPALKEHDWQIVTHQPFKRGENIHIYLHFIYTYIYTHIYRYTHTHTHKNIKIPSEALTPRMKNGLMCKYSEAQCKLQQWRWSSLVLLISPAQGKIGKVNWKSHRHRR